MSKYAAMKKEEIIKILTKKKIKHTKSSSKDDLVKLLVKEEKSSSKKAVAKKTTTKKSSVKVVKSPTKKTVKITSKTVKPSTIVKDELEKYHSLPDYDHIKKMNNSLPESYGLHKLVLLAIDPLWLYAYWEINPEIVKELTKRQDKKDLNTKQLYLKVFDVTNSQFIASNEETIWEYKSDQLKGNWFINTNQPERLFMAVIGFKNKAGHFFPILSSEKISTPRNKMSDNLEQTWASIDIDKPLSMQIKEDLKKYIDYQMKSGQTSSLGQIGGLFEDLFGSNPLFKNN